MDEKSSSRVTSVDLGRQIITHTWISFAADPGQKARCLARLHEARLGPDNQPSDCVAGGKYRFSEELGMPEMLAVVIDVLCWLRQSEGKISACEQAMELIEAIPVGADLGAVPHRFAHWLLHDPQWGIDRYCYMDPLKTFSARIKALHDRERAGQVIDEAEWQALEQDIGDYADAGVAAEEDSKNLGNLLASLATPLSRIDAEQMGRLCGAAAYFAGEQTKASYWTDSEQRQLDGLYGAFRASVEQTLGPCPPQQQTVELSAWIKQEQALDAAWEKQMRQQQRLLWRRWDAWGEQQASLYAAFNVSATDLILSLFRLAPRRDVFAPSQRLH